MNEFETWFNHENQAELRASCAKGWALRIWLAARATTCPGHGRSECVSCCWPMTGYTAVDMCTAAADGYRDGKASIVYPKSRWGDPFSDGWNACLEKIQELNT